MNGKYKIEKNLCLCTTDKHNPKSVFLEGNLWVAPTEEYDMKTLYKKLKEFVDKIIPQEHLSIFEIPKNTDIGRRSSFYVQIHFKNPKLEKFDNYCERITPLILEKKPLFLRLLNDCGLEYYQTKKDA